MQTEIIESLNADGFGLHVEFLRQTDRYGHRVWLVQSGHDPELILDSVEGKPNEDWPASPPLQTLTLEMLPSGQCVALLVGMAGRSHWSASFEATQKGFVCDIACRHAAQPQWLGSQYQRLARPGFVQIYGLDSEVHTQSESVLIQPRLTNPGSATTRWKYSLNLTTSQL